MKTVQARITETSLRVPQRLYLYNKIECSLERDKDIKNGAVAYPLKSLFLPLLARLEKHESGCR